MSQNVTSKRLLLLLDQVDVGLHALGLKVLRKLPGGQTVGMQTSQRDELHNEASLSKLPNELLEILLVEAMSGPVETGTQVVDQPLTGVLLADLSGKGLGLSKIRRLGLKPEQIGVRSKCNCALEGRL